MGGGEVCWREGGGSSTLWVWRRRECIAQGRLRWKKGGGGGLDGPAKRRGEKKSSLGRHPTLPAIAAGGGRAAIAMATAAFIPYPNQCFRTVLL